MSHEHSPRCPNCGRELTEDELYCYFCEINLRKTNPKTDENHGHDKQH